MNSTPEQRYRKLFNSIAQSHPRTAVKLQSIEEQFGLQASHYAAALIACLESRVQVSGVQAAGVLSLDDLDKFSYFGFMKDNWRALELLVEVLECHLEECQASCSRSSIGEIPNPISPPIYLQKPAQVGHTQRDTQH